MPCCSAYDALSATTPLATALDPNAAPGTKAAAPDPGGPLPPGYDCKNDGCYEYLEANGRPCPKGKCVRNEKREKVAEHDAPRCKKHPWGGP